MFSPLPRLKLRERRMTARAQKTPASQPRKAEDDVGDDDDEEVLLHIPASFDVEDHDGDVARRAGAGTVCPFDAVGMLRNLWRRMCS